RQMTQKKKKVMIKRNTYKILKQNSLASRIHIRIGFSLIGIALIAGLIYAFGKTFSTVLCIYLGYKLLKWTGRLLRLVLSFVFTLVPIIILIAIISLLIF
ncbi:MAG: hypothetical protein LBO74_17815, partial [Candidatus Symbiothrix sp.]|nr:hypothetical protein [Candidatus Symbiothrix sp.]